MKKLFTGIVAIALFMGMSVPVMAAVDASAYLSNYEQAVSNHVQPSDYPYVAWLRQDEDDFIAICSATPIIKSGDAVRRMYYRLTQGLWGSYSATYSGLTSAGLLKFNVNYTPASVNLVSEYIIDVSTASFADVSMLSSSNFSYIYGIPIDTTLLKSLITQAGLKVQSDYTAATWSTLQAAVNDANALLTGGTYTQSEIDAMCSRLQAAINGLEPIPVLPDTRELRETLVEAKAIEDIGYTVFSWSQLRAAIYEGDELLARPTYTAPQVATATTNVRTAIVGLEIYVAPDPGNHRYIVDGIRLVDLLPAQDAIMDNFKAARQFGLYIFVVLLGIMVMVRLVKKFIHIFDGGSTNSDSKLR